MKSQTGSADTDKLRSRIIGSLPAVFYMTHTQSRFAGPRFLSDAASAFVGYDAQAFISDEDLWPSRIHGDDFPHVLSQLAAIPPSGSLTMKYRWRCADDSEKTFFDLATLVSGGATPSILGLSLAITPGFSIIDSTPPDSIARAPAVPGDLREIRHELNNMVSVILWNLQPVTKSLQGTGKDLDRVRNALRAAARCIELVQLLPGPD